MSYFHRTGATTFRPSEHVGGGWAPHEQHVAPAFGLLVHVIESDRDARRGDDLVVARLSYDILGTLPIDEVSTTVTVVRPGRTIELVEARLSHGGRDAVLGARGSSSVATPRPCPGPVCPGSLPPGHAGLGCVVRVARRLHRERRRATC